MTSYNYFMEKILKFDVYGKKPLLRINQYESYRTLFGSCLSIGSIILMISTTIYFGLQLLDKTHPIVVLSIINSINPPQFNLSSDNFGLAFGLQDPSTYDQFIDETIYRVEVYQKIATRQPDNSFNWSIIPIQVERCNNQKFPLPYKNLSSDLPLSDLYCLMNTSFSIFGTFLNPTYSFLYIEVFECKNTTTLQKCRPKSDIDTLLSGTFFSFSFTDITIDPTNFTYPNQKFMGDSYTTVSNRYFKEMHHYEKQIKIETNNGWLIDDFSTNTYLQLDYIKEMIDFRVADNFLSYTFKMSTIVENTTRTYKKVQNVAAEVGGIFKLISVLCIVCTSQYNKAKINETLTNELFRLVKNEDEDKRKSVNLSKLIEKSTIVRIEDVDKSYSPESSQQIPKGNKNVTFNTNIVKLNNFIHDFEENKVSRISETVKEKSIAKNIKLTCCQGCFIYLLPCCFNNRNRMILEIAEPEIDSKFEIMNIFKQLNELNRLKVILFDEEQQKLLSIPHKTILNLNIMKKSKTLSILESNHQEKMIEDCKKAYYKVKERKNDIISQKLCKTIEEDIQYLIE